MAHINSPIPASPRHNPDLSPAAIDDYENLMLLCPAHNRIVGWDNENFPATRLREMRNAHLDRIALLLAGQPGLGANKFRKSVDVWKSERGNSQERFWQKLFKENPELLLPASGGRPYIVNSQGYVGGKSSTGQGANLPDFIAQCDGNVVLIEIKTPTTKLMGARYRGNVYPPSKELAGSCIQVLEYRASLMNNLHNLFFHNHALHAPNPTTVVIAGDTQNPVLEDKQRRSFELFRHSLKDVTVLTYDELFGSIADLAAMMEAQ